MKAILGLILMLLGIVVGLWLGVWWGFVGGIIQVIQNATPIVNPVGIAYGLARIFILSSFIGWTSFIVLFGIGNALLQDA